VRPARHLAFVVVALLACLALPLAIVSTWTANVVTDSDGYVRAVGPLADDPTVQEAVEERLRAEVLARLPRVPPQTVRRAVVRVVEGPEFRPAWEDANRSAHDQLLTTLEASEDSPVANDGTVTIDLGPLLVAVIEAVDTRGLVDTSNAPALRTQFELVSAQQLEQARTTYRLVHLAGLWMPVVWLLLLAAALLVAANRRRALAWLALGSLVCAGGLLVAATLARREVIDRAATADSELIGAIWDVVTAGLRNGAWLAVAGSVVVLLLALTLGLLVGRFRSARS
jgi:hypothetical protein